MLLMIWTTPVQTKLQVEKIESNSGYTILQEKEIQIPESFNYSLHIIDLKEIYNVIRELRINIRLLPTNVSYSLLRDVESVQDKLRTLQNGHHSIQKRGLFNFLGTINKWVIGTMDDDDRQMINQHLEYIDTNNYHFSK